MAPTLPRLTWLLALAACAETTAPLPPPVEVLVVLHRTQAQLTVVPVDAPSESRRISFAAAPPLDAGLALRQDVALVAAPADDAVLVVDLQAGVVLRRLSLPAGGGAGGVAILDDSIAYAASPGTDQVVRLNYRSGATAALAVGRTPLPVIATRGRVFVVSANLATGPCGAAPACPAGASWITVVDPITNQRATGIDSILLPGPGNARYAEVAPDGLLYVVSQGNGLQEARLSIVSPVARAELGNFGGFGSDPGALAADVGERLFVASRTFGLMEFNTRTRSVVRGAGAGAAIPDNVGVEVDSRGRVWALEAGPCTPGAPGRLQLLRDDLTVAQAIQLDECPWTVAATALPAGG